MSVPNPPNVNFVSLADISLSGSNSTQLNGPLEDQPEVFKEALEWTRSGSNFPYDPCWYHRSKKDKQLQVPGPLKFNLDLQYVPDTNIRHTYNWDKCHLLSLPKDLRILIWKYVLTEPSEPMHIVRIDRKPFHPSYKLTRAPEPELTFAHVGYKFSMSPEVLRTNRLIYDEALPILYEAVSFMPGDSEGLLPIFYATLSPFARSSIRNVTLQVPSSLFGHSDRPKILLQWAVTCAQVAQLNGTLQQVDIMSTWTDLPSIICQGEIVAPVCKIKADKRFYDSSTRSFDRTADFLIMLQTWEKVLESRAIRREERAKAGVAELVSSEEREISKRKRDGNASPIEIRTRAAPFAQFHLPLKHRATHGKHPTDDAAVTSVSESENLQGQIGERMVSNLGDLPHKKSSDSEAEQSEGGFANISIPVVESDGEDWDIISVGSGATTPVPLLGDSMSKVNDTSAGETLLADDKNAQELRGERPPAKDREGWEYIHT